MRLRILAGSFIFIRPGGSGLFSSPGRKAGEPVAPKTFFLSPGGALQRIQSPLRGLERRRLYIPTPALRPGLEYKRASGTQNNLSLPKVQMPGKTVTPI